MEFLVVEDSDLALKHKLGVGHQVLASPSRKGVKEGCGPQAGRGGGWNEILTGAESSSTAPRARPRPPSAAFLPLRRQVRREGEQRGRVRRASGGEAEGTASGVPREAFQPGDLAFPPDLCPPRAALAPCFTTLRNTLFFFFVAKSLESIDS